MWGWQKKGALQIIQKSNSGGGGKSCSATPTQQTPNLLASIWLYLATTNRDELFSTLEDASRDTTRQLQLSPPFFTHGMA